MDKHIPITSWLPVTKKEADQRGWDQLDVILISGDAYIDHPSFGMAVIGRLMENMGLRVAIVPQPNWQDDLRDFKKFGRPRLFFGVSSGAMDSMVNHYTAHKRLRSNDSYTPANRAGARPDYATTVYTKILKDLFPDVPIVLGGVEASLRRFTHYDYWSDQLRPSILADTNADLLVYGMGEEAIVEICQKLEQRKSIVALRDIPQTAYLSDKIPGHVQKDSILLHSHEGCLKSKKKFANNFKYIEQESNKVFPKVLVQPVGNKYVVVNTTYPIPEEKKLDEVYDLPYTRLPHPKYRFKGPIPAYEMIKNSVSLHRGCFGGCSFCTISAHQGKFIASRSEESVLRELKKIAETPGFNGVISDLGGPSANMYKMKGIHQPICDTCTRPSCIFPSVCRNLNTDHNPMTRIYQEAEKIPGIKKVFVGSGIRYDMFTDRPEEEAKRNGYEEYQKQLISKHVSGRLKVAPEHTSDEILKIMRKPTFNLFTKFKKQFDRINQEAGKKQQIIPYFISSHPGSDIKDMADLAVKTKDVGLRLEQVQDFTPTPMTLATVMYYTGIDPYSGKEIYRADSVNQKRLQQKFFFWYKPENRKILKNALNKAGLKNMAEKLYG
ncbi:MAG: YgiQ family radical SAM protein [Bacteroidales bacterium]